MGEHIDREKLYKKIYSAYITAERCGFEPGKDVILLAIKQQPAADVAPVRHGRWMWDGGEDTHYYCSQCHHNAYGCSIEILDGVYKYCPSCGAKMEESEP